MVTKKDRAVEIRDHVLALVRRDGAPRGHIGQRAWQSGRFQAALFTRFNPLPSNFTDPPTPTYAHAAVLQQAAKPKANLLDVWFDRHKCLSIEWDDASVNVIGMKRGAWEDELLSMPREG